MKTNKTTINLHKNDIAIKISPEGESEIYVPFSDKGDNEITHEQIHKMLKEIRELEKVFTHLTNLTYVEEDEDDDNN